MDGRGRCMDNVFVERLGAAYEEVYLKASKMGLRQKGDCLWPSTTKSGPDQALGRSPGQVFQ